MKTKIYGASDDLIEIEGFTYDEIDCVHQITDLNFMRNITSTHGVGDIDQTKIISNTELINTRVNQFKTNNDENT